MIIPDTSNWKSVGSTSNTDYFDVEPGVLACVPHKGALDDENTARENVAFQNKFFREKEPGCTVIFVDLLRSQDKGARRVYQEHPDLDVFLGAALVGGTALSRAIGSFFVGLARPKVPLRMTASLDEAFSWARGKRADHDKRTTP
jgi:hypothetical protein